MDIAVQEIDFMTVVPLPDVSVVNLTTAVVTLPVCSLSPRN